MNLRLRAIETLDEALGFADALQHAADESTRSFREDDLAPGLAERFLRERFDQREALLVVAEGEGRATPFGLCATARFEDPLTGEASALIVALYVDSTVRHHGVARALVEEVRRRLATRGVTRLAGRTEHNDDALISMGERWGFLRAWELMVRD